MTVLSIKLLLSRGLEEPYIDNLVLDSQDEKIKIINTYSMKQPELYHFETIKMTSQAQSNFVWRIRAAGLPEEPFGLAKSLT